MAGKALGNKHLTSALAKWREDQARLQKDAAAVPAKKPAPKRDHKRTAKPKRSAAASPAASEAPTSNKAFLQTATPKKAAAAETPIAKQLKDALELLAEKREPVVLGAITARYGHDTGPSSALLAALRDSVKAVELPDGKFMYKATHTLADKAALLAFVRRVGGGVMLADVRDAYASVEADVAELRKSGALWLLPGPLPGDVVLYASDELPLISVAEDVAALWHAVEVPVDPDQLLDEMSKAGLPPAQRRGSRKRVPPPPKEKRKRKQHLRTVTNQHMPWLFAGTAPAQID